MRLLRSFKQEQKYFVIASNVINFPFLSTVILAVAASTAWSGDWRSLSGRIESLADVDNRRFGSEHLLEQWADVQYSDTRRELYSGLNLSWRQRGGHAALKVRQLFIEKGLPGHTLRAGRMQRSDALGYYNLDGLALTSPVHAATLEVHAGVPRRIEDYRTVEGDALYGLTLRFGDGTTSLTTLPGEFALQRARLGWQRFKNGQSQERIAFGFSARHQEGAATYPASLGFSGGWLLDSRTLEELVAQLEVNTGKDSRLRLAASVFEPERPFLDFRERFYSLYALGRQTTLQSSYHARLHRETEWSVTGRYLAHEEGANGFGLSAGASMRKPTGLESEVRVDALQLDNDRVVTFFLGGSAPLDSRLQLDLAGALQFHDKALTGENAALAAEVKIEYMLGSGFYAAGYATFVFNSNLDEEYRLLARLSWYFDEQFRGRLQ